jgi:arylsulfatase A-like enzyme
MNQPNILLITIDALRADMLGCYGYSKSVTPNIDRQAARSIRFDQAITGGSWTQAAFPVLLTSTYASWYGGCLGPLAPERPSPIELLATRGYTAAAFSTSPLLSRKYGYQRGFRRFEDLVPVEQDPMLRRVKGGERFLRIPLIHYLSKPLGIRMRPARLYVSAEALTDVVIRGVESARKPFLIWAHYMDVHWPYHLEETLSHPQEIAQAWRDLAHLYNVNWNGSKITSDQREHYRTLYERALSYADAQIGRLLHRLEELNLFGNTVVILVSDHGEEFLERKHWGHFEINLHDEILRVPLIIYLPELKTGHVVSRQVRTLDIMPTILDLCGCSQPEELQGTSLRPLWSQREEEYRSDLSISEMWRDHRHIIAVRTVNFKYIWDSYHQDRPLLFDLVTDPEETHNLINRYPDHAGYFQTIVDDHRQAAVRTDPGKELVEPQLDDVLIRRLRDLGYVE